MQGSKYGDEIREKACALLCAGNTLTYVSNELNVPCSTLVGWKNSFEKTNDNFVELRNKRKEEFIEKSWDVITNSVNLLKRRMERALKSEEEIDRLVEEASKQLSDAEKKALSKRISEIKVEDPGKVAVILGTLYDKQALANKEATTIVNGDLTIKKFEEL